MNVKFVPYDDRVYYEPLNEDSSYEALDDFIDWFKQTYQSDKIKIDITVGIGLKYLDVLNI